MPSEQSSLWHCKFFVSGLAWRREKRREAWIRKLNSYENFYRAVAQLVDLQLSGAEIPDDQFWASVGEARKAAYDATPYDPTSPERTKKMRDLSLELALSPEDHDEKRLIAISAEAERLRRAFFSEERLA